MLASSLVLEWVENFEKPKGDPSAYIKPATTVLSLYLKNSESLISSISLSMSPIISSNMQHAENGPKVLSSGILMVSVAVVRMYMGWLMSGIVCSVPLLNVIIYLLDEETG